MTDTARLVTALADRYRIERELGAGGMATVYLAHDVRHDRNVALKVLRPELSAILGAERFLKEIRLTANLQHPHILALHDSGEAEGVVFYVMPYVEGESLRDRLVREKQLPVEDAVRIAREVAGALDYAHRHGVVHRDIKPENILLHDGSALVADFGIALAASRSDGSTRMTETGMSLGTPHYMSPEQAMGQREITNKADIYALGVVTYEMLTGEPPFTGPTAQAIIARVMTEEPRSLTMQRHTIPPHLDAVVHKALEKLPADRFATAALFAEALVTPGSVPLSTTATGVLPVRGTGGRGRKALRVAAAVGVIAMAAAAGATVTWRRAEPAATIRFAVRLPPDQNVINGPGTLLAITRDGLTLAYHGVGPTANGAVWIRRMSDLRATRLEGSDTLYNARFSPDGRSIAMVGQGGRIYALSLEGGPPVVVADSAWYPTGEWATGDELYFTHKRTRGLARVSLSRHVVEPLTTADSTEVHGWPQLLPGGRDILFTIVNTVTGAREIAAYAVASHTVKRLFRGGYAQYAASGHLVYAREDGALLAVPFDARRLEVTGPAIPLFGETLGAPTDIPDFVISDNGTLVYLVADQVSRDMVWVDRTGRGEPLDTALRQEFTSLALSPDGRSLALAYTTGAEGGRIALFDLQQRILVPLTGDSGRNRRPSWTPDGLSVLYTTGPATHPLLMSVPANRTTGAQQLLPRATRGGYSPEISSDGRWLYYTAVRDSASGLDIMYAEIGVDTVSRPLVATRDDDAFPAVSSDGRWLAHVSAGQLWVQSFPRPDRRWPVAVSATEPAWSHDGRELYYVADGNLMVAAFGAAGVGARRKLFDLGGLAIGFAGHSYAPSRDDQRFLMIRSIGGTRSMVAVVNWFAELERRTTTR